MTERMKQFFEAASKNEKALAVLKSLKELSLAEQREQITALAAEVGVTLMEDDFKQVDGAELTDEELEQAAGAVGWEELPLYIRDDDKYIEALKSKFLLENYSPDQLKQLIDEML